MKPLQRLITIFTLRCEAASELSSRQLDDPLDLADRIALMGHLVSCGNCRQFHQQLRRIHQTIRARDPLENSLNPTAAGLTPEAHARIARAIHEASQTGPDDNERRSGAHHQ